MSLPGSPTGRRTLKSCCGDARSRAESVEQLANSHLAVVIESQAGTGDPCRDLVDHLAPLLGAQRRDGGPHLVEVAFDECIGPLAGHGFFLSVTVFKAIVPDVGVVALPPTCEPRQP